ncbi:MAG: heavy metal translocating P-type ATPase [Candidatus Niameybacter stercoravium]|nr:heavy metal translocating P-type ATPase [Candidatus Niameybacter stercoravium]
MTCAACARAVERTVKKSEGVEEVNVNMATERLVITYNPKVLEEKMLIAAVEKVGYGVLLDEAEEESREDQIGKLKLRFILSLIFVIPLFYISMGHMVGLPLPMSLNPQFNPFNYAFIQFAFTTPILLIGYRFFEKGFKALLKMLPNMDSLVAIGSLAAYLYGIFAIIQISASKVHYVHQLYFESVGVILTLITLGKYLEAVSIGKTSKAIENLIKLAPETAIILKDGKPIEVRVEELQVGEILFVKPGERIPCDGIIIEGTTAIDESMLTGESIPVEKKSKDKVIGGSINQTGAIKFEATEVGKDTALSKIIKLVEDAQGKKAPIAKLADTISSYFVPMVIVLAILASIAWTFAGADVGIAIGKGTDVAIESASIVLMHSDPMDVPLAIDLSKKTIRNIRQNLFWAFGYNTLGIPVAMGVLHIFGGPLLNPMFAAAAMSLSSVSVVLNALRLKGYKMRV